MKKMIAMLLAVVMVFGLAACGNTAETPNDAPAASLEGTMEELVNQVITENPVEFMGGMMPVDLADTSEDGLWALKRYTGLDNADQIQDAAVYEPMMGSLAFSLVMVRAKDGVDAKALAESMKAGIDPRKWICVEADELMVAGYGDVVMLIMVSTIDGMSAQPFVDAFQKVCAAQFEGTQLDFTI